MTARDSSRGKPNEVRVVDRIGRSRSEVENLVSAHPKVMGDEGLVPDPSMVGGESDSHLSALIEAEPVNSWRLVSG